jgi:4'-phosphopantetheinyl transferase
LIADAETQYAAPARAGAFVGDELWCVDLVDSAQALAQMERSVPRLSPDDVQTARAMTDPAVAGDWLTARAGLRLLLERAAGPDFRRVPFVRTPHGKPWLEDAPVSFSLAHVKGLALIGLKRAGAIGVDIECARKVRVGPERRGRIEAAGVALNPQVPMPEAGDGRFLQAWVRLESFAKADGGGIGQLLTRLGIIGGNRADADEISDRAAKIRDVERVVTHDVKVDGWLRGESLFAAVALPAGQGAPAVRWLPCDVAGLEALLT